jgi:hypothetical protein
VYGYGYGSNVERRRGGRECGKENGGDELGGARNGGEATRVEESRLRVEGTDNVKRHSQWARHKKRDMQSTMSLRSLRLADYWL